MKCVGSDLLEEEQRLVTMVRRNVGIGSQCVTRQCITWSSVRRNSRKNAGLSGLHPGSHCIVKL